MQLMKRKCPWPLVFHGLISVILGTTILLWREELTNMLLDCFLILKRSSYILEEWSNPSAKVNIELFYFNWTNPNDLKNKSIKPQFEELGPYFFAQEYKKVDIAFNENHTITYRNQKFFHFDETKSKGSLDDAITSLNVIPTATADKSRNWNYVMRKLLSISLNGVPYESTKPLKELLFIGYKDPLLTTASYLPFLDNIPDMDKFAWFYKRNGSTEYEGIYTMGTGQGNTTLGTVYKWNYKHKGSYPGHCGNIEAHMEIFPRMKKDRLDLFNSDFCRRVILDYNKTVTYEGMEAYKFTAGASFLDSGTFNPENKCLCSRKCQKFGVVEYSACKYGIPAYISLPHFLKADPSFRTKIEGMKPSQKNHESYVMINSRTGIVVETKLAIQINLLLEPNPLIRKYNDVPEIMFPIFWFSVDMKLTDPVITKLKLLNFIPIALKAISAILVFLGMIILIHSLHRRLADIQRRDIENITTDYEKNRNHLVQRRTTKEIERVIAYDLNKNK
ncbi:hypothetical protein WA026_016005 [Henosepilachna vigintioctopunctata]|uniref:Uncharacterized protein n=1 Tax=Henosepilachna vigintioctopunctata TaxID=420089 RepID=A0AAW1UAN1_9CUCU